MKVKSRWTDGGADLGIEPTTTNYLVDGVSLTGAEYIQHKQLKRIAIALEKLVAKAEEGKE